MITVCAQRVQDLSQVFEALLQRSLSQNQRDCYIWYARDFDLNMLLPLYTNSYCRARSGYTDCVFLKTSKSIFAGDLLTVDAESAQL